MEDDKNNNNISNSVQRFKKCKVCCDKATGINFNGLSCESCKAFFRRNAHKNKCFIICKKNGNCTIDKWTRKYCKRCRLDKCFAIGMRKELIWSYKFGKLCLNNVYFNDNFVINDFYENGKNCLEIIQQSTSKPGTDLNAHELSLICEIQKALAHFGDENKLDIIGETSDLIQSLNVMGHYIRKVVKFCKNMSAFRCLKQDDQLLILKPFFTELILIWVSFHFNFERDGFPWEVQHENRAILLKLDTHYLRNSNFPRIYRKFAFSLKGEMQNDHTIRDLIIAYFLFTPRDGASCLEYLRYQYHVYCQLLRRYLEHRYSDKDKENVKFSRFMKILQEMSDLKDSVNKIFTEVDSRQILQVYTEIYNIKNFVK